MAIEYQEQEEQTQEAVTVAVATEIFRDILGDPSLKSTVFQNLVTAGEIQSVGVTKRQFRLYPRAEVIRLAEERKALKKLVTSNQIVERAAKRGVTIKIREIQFWTEDGRLPVARKSGNTNYYQPQDADRAINAVIKRIKMAENVRGMRSPRDSVAWINALLEKQGRDDRIDLERFYTWCARELIIPDYKMPHGSGQGRLFYFTEETLANAPIFRVTTDVPVMQEKPEVVHVTSSKVLAGLEEQWGELLIREGIREQELSVHAVSKKDRVVYPVGRCGPVQWFPLRYIPEKLRRRRNTKDVIDEAFGS